MHEIAFTLLGYPISYLELVGTVAGLLSVWLAVKNHVATWPVGLINVTAFAILFYEFRLYSDALLQVYFFGMSLYGWWVWRTRNQPEERVLTLSGRQRWGWLGILGASTLVLGAVMSRIDVWAPALFPEPAAYPFPDAFTTVTSVVATYLLARRYLESWALWVLVDIVSVVLYFSKGILLVGWEYVVFLGLAASGGWRWWRNLRSPKPAV
ncbi:MAG: nicotinamide riboside transporter PnuC [Bacteroidota bacterium]